MSGKALAATVVFATVAVWSSSCSTPPAPRPHSQDVQACFDAAPGDWVSAFAAHSARLPNGTMFTLLAVSGDAGFGQYTSGAGDGVGSVDLATGRLSLITSFQPGTGGLGALAVDPGWVVWEQLDSATNIMDWSVHALNRMTGAAVQLATSRAGDGYVTGQQPLPVLRAGTAAWAQPIQVEGSAGQAQLRVADLANGRLRTLDSGRLSSPVYAGPYLLWAQVSDAGDYTFKAVDAVTFRSVTLPERLSHPASIGYLGGSPTYLAWSTADHSRLTTWRVGSDEYRHFTQDGTHPFQFLQVVDDFLLWYTGKSSAVLDLTTGGGLDLPGTVAASPTWLVTAQPEHDRGGGIAARVGHIPTATTPHLPACPT